MKPAISWFTGTPLPAAERIYAPRGDTKLVPIASLLATPDRVLLSADRVGFGCPVYDKGTSVFAGKLHQRGHA